MQGGDSFMKNRITYQREINVGVDTGKSQLVSILSVQMDLN